MGAYREEQQSTVVALARSRTEAEFIQMTLAAHGIVASVSPRDLAYPSLDFVQGIRVSVIAEDEEAARELLAGTGLGSDPPSAAPPLPDDSVSPDDPASRQEPQS